MSDETPVSPAQRTAILELIATSTATKKDKFPGIEEITIDGARFHKEYPELFKDKTATMRSYRAMITSVLDALAPNHNFNLPGIPSAVEINGNASDIAALQTKAKLELCVSQYKDPYHVCKNDTHAEGAPPAHRASAPAVDAALKR